MIGSHQTHLQGDEILSKWDCASGLFVQIWNIAQLMDLWSTTFHGGTSVNDHLNNHGEVPGTIKYKPIMLELGVKKILALYC